MLITSPVATSVSSSSRATNQLRSWPLIIGRAVTPAVSNPASDLRPQTSAQKSTHNLRAFECRSLTSDVQYLTLIFLLRRLVIDFHARSWTHRAQNFVTPGHDLVPFSQPFEDLNIRGSCDPSNNGHIFGLAVANYKHTLNFFFIFIFLLGCRVLRSSGLHSAVLGLAFQVRLPSNRQCLNRNCQRLAASRRRDFCRRRKSRPQILRRILQGHHNFEILRFLTRRCLLRSRNTRRAHNRVIPNFCDYSLKSFLASIETSAGCPIVTFTMSVSSTLT